MRFRKIAAGMAGAAMLLTQTMPAAAAVDDEILHLTFDNEDASDSSTAGNHASAHSIRYERGVLGKAARIVNENGSTAETVSSYIELADSMEFGTDDLTFSFWYKTDTGSEGGGAVIGNKDYDSGANDGFIIGSFSQNIRANFAFNRTRKDNTFGHVDGLWHHLAVTLDRDGAMTTYEDGVKKGSADISEFSDKSLDINTWRIGADGIGSYGLIDEVQIFRGVKSESDIQTLYHNVKDQMEQEDLTGKTVLNASFDGNVQDASGRENHGTMHGDIEYTEGISGKALHIVNEHGSSSAAADQYVDFGAASDLQFGTDDFTLSYWAKSDNGVSDGGALISNKDYNSGSNTGFAVGDFNNGFRTNFRAEGSSRRDIYGMAPIDGLWHYMVITFDRDGKITAYKDGKESGSVNIASDAGKSINAGRFTVGADGYGKWALNDAYIDELQVIRGIADISNARETYVNSLYAYGIRYGQKLIADAGIYAPSDPALLDAARDAYATAQAAENADLEEKAAAAEALGAALAALEKAMPEYDETLMLSVSFDAENAADESGRGNDGTIAGSPVFEQGISGKAIRIQNANYGTKSTAAQYVAFGDREDLKFGTGDFSFSLWYKENKDNRECSILGNKDWDSGANPGVNLGIVGRGLQLNFTPNGASRSDLDPGHVNDGHWHHLAASFDRDGNMVLYKDGEVAGTRSIASTKDKSIDVYQWVLGADSLMNYGLQDALLDEVKIWNRTLDAEEVREMASIGSVESAIQDAEEELKNSDASQARKDALQKSITSIREDLSAGVSIARLTASLNQALEAFRDPNADPIVSFNVLSDVHVDSSQSASQNANLADALQDLEYLNPNSIATMFPGDLTNGGADAQYTAFYDLLDTYSAAWPIPALGNHDVRWLCSSENRNEAGLRIPTCVEGTSPFKQRYLSRNAKYMGDTPEGQLYFDQWIGGYHFITLNTEKDLKDQAYISEEQTQWLASVLEGSEKDKPIFIQIHQTFKGTADHEELDWIGEDSEERIIEVLKNYPQSVIFTGHVHNGKNLIDVYNREFGHVVDAPCFYYSSYGDSQNRIAYQVNVYEDDVQIRLRDFAADEWLDDYEIHVDLDALDLTDDSRDVDPSTMTITAGSEHASSGSEGPASNLLDGDTSTIWHTSYSGSGTTMDQRWLEIGLTSDTWIDAVRYLPRQNGSNGTILKADVYTSADHGQTWNKAASASWKGSAVWKSVSFAPVIANAVRIVPTETIGEYASGAEIRVAQTALDLRGRLEALVEKAAALNPADYTEATAAALVSALAHARNVLENEGTADQNFLDAIEALNSAINALEPNASIRIATYNIAAGKNPDLEAINSQMKDKQIDIAGLQEIDVNTGRNSFDMLERIASYKTFPYTHFQKAIDFSGGFYGIGTVSAQEILETSGASYEHAIGENRVWQRSLIEKDGKQIALYNTHLSYENTTVRAGQMEELIAAVKADPVPYKAITGDFNADQFHEEFYPFLGDFNMVNGWNTEWTDTYNGVDDTMKVYSIDNIITTRNLRLVNSEVIDNRLSDHNMMWAEFQFLEEEAPSTQYLQFILKEARAIENAGYTSASWNRLQAAIAAAENTEGMSQQEIDACREELSAAMDQLAVYRDTRLLEAAVAYANAIDAEDLKDVNSIVLARFHQALSEAQSVLENAASSQSEINTAWSNLTNAIHMLDFRSDKTRLNALILQAESLNEADYSADAWAALQAALEEARAVAGRDTALNDSINAATDALQAALDALQPSEEIDTSLLQLIVEETSKADLSLYLDGEAKEAFVSALAAAQAVLENPQSQSAVNTAAVTLHEAWLSLRLRPDESLLAYLKDFSARAAKADPALYSAEEYASLMDLSRRIDTGIASGSLDADQVQSLADEASALEGLLARKAGEVPAASDRLQNAGVNNPAVSSSVKTASATHAGWTAALGAAALGLFAALKRRKKH